MTSESNKQQPRVSIMLPPGPLRDRILEVLEESNVQVKLLGDDSSLSKIQSMDSDVLVVHTDQMDSDDLEALADSSEGELGTGIAIIGEDDPTQRARLFAAGASHVMSELDDAQVVGESLEALAETEAEGGAHGPEVRGNEAEPRLTDFLTRSPTMREFVDLVQRVVAVDTSLLVTGPTGVGKERLARAIHAEGPRSKGPFLSVNCGALPEALLESELFGHEKGAFTGADRQRRGHFECAAGGTIFLDEIGEMPVHLQVKLLTVLQRHEVVRVGGQKPIAVDVRVIAATNRDLSDEVKQRRFREDLFYRLNVVALELPALSERPDDIPDLAGRFIAHFREVMPDSSIESIAETAVDALLSYRWPGNVRELINVIERAMVLGKGTEIALSDLPQHIARHDPVAAQESAPPRESLPSQWQGLSLREVRDLAVRDSETAFLRILLKESGGHIAETAKRAGLSARALYERMKRYGLRKEDFKS